jgi:hypothetical protein
MQEALWMVKVLFHCEGSDAKPSLIVWVTGVTLDLDDVVVVQVNFDATTAVTPRTC